jgi:O-antigen ligase
MTPISYANKYMSKIRKIVVGAFLILPFILVFNDGGNYAFSLWINDMVFFMLMIAFTFHTPSDKQLRFIKWLIIFLYLYILLQMYASVLGLHTFDLNNREIDGMNFIRGSTKAGDSIMSSIVLFLFCVMITGYFINNYKLNLVIITLTLIPIAMGASRGPLLAIIGYFVVYMIAILRGRSFAQKLVSIIISVILIAVAIQFNIFADILLRQEQLSESGDITSNRFDLIQTSLEKAMSDSPIFGVGQGRIYPPTRELARFVAAEGPYSRYNGAPHNLWIVTLCEYGIVGLLCMIGLFVLLLKQMNIRMRITWGVIFVFLILFNTESGVIFDQTFMLICLLITMAVRKNEINIAN